MTNETFKDIEKLESDLWEAADNLRANDAEQVICAELDKKDNFRMKYVSGAIENPKINKAIIDVLEGTRPAFDNRDSKYLSP